jgi:hypothetical protein
MNVTSQGYRNVINKEAEKVLLEYYEDLTIQIEPLWNLKNEYGTTDNINNCNQKCCAKGSGKRS